MIMIDPIKDVVDPNTDAIRSSINYKFAEYLKTYIEIKGDTCRLTRYSEDAPVVSLQSLVNNYHPLVTITINCYADLDKSVHGYDVICDANSALVGTIVYEMYKQGLTPINNTGYTVNNTLKYGKYADITIYLGYVTNADDLELLTNDDALDLIAKRIVEGAYGPPVKQVEDTDPAGNNDPYFYRIDTWEEFDKEEGDSSGKILDMTYSGLPLRYLTVDSKATGFYPVPEPDTLDTDDDGEDPPLIPRHYTWYTELTYTKPETVLFIGSLRANTDTTAYIKVGSTEFTKVINSADFTIVIFEAEVDTGDCVYIGVEGSGKIDYSGIWVSPKGSLGTLDDPRSLYSIFPPGYRSITRVSSAYNTANAIHIAVTDARSLLERAQDKYETNPVQQQEDTSSNSPVDFVFTALGYAQALSSLVKMLGNIDPKILNIVDPSLINLDYQALEKSMVAIKDITKKTSVLAAVNDIKIIADSVGSLTTSKEDLQNKAKAVADKAQQKIEAKGNSLSTDTSKITDVANKVNEQTAKTLEKVENVKSEQSKSLYNTEKTAKEKLHEIVDSTKSYRR